MTRPPWLQRLDPCDGWMDREWATVTELRSDGANRIVLLTIDRVERFIWDTWNGRPTLSWSIPRT